MKASANHAPAAHDGERGVALILGVLFTIIVLGVTAAGTMYLRAHQTKTRINFIAHGQALGFARSGLTEALGWLRKQTAQPVTDFEPVLDPGASPPILDTSDPDIGIVREFEISGSIWGRYEVWKDWPTDPIPTRLAWRNQFAVRDVSAERAGLTEGSIWQLRSIGYVFRRTDAAVAFNQAPNGVLGQEILNVEARRLALLPPGPAAINITTGTACIVASGGRVFGGMLGAGIYFESGTPTSGTIGTGRVTGTPAYTQAPLANGVTTYDSSLPAVFGVSLDELKSMADNYINDPTNFVSPVPKNTLVVADTPITFSSARPLDGTAVVVVIGNMTIAAGSGSAFSGLLYVDGNLTINAPAEIQGTVICTGSINISGSSDFSVVTYDDGILNRLRQELGTYRFSSAVNRPMAH
jgi:hypothetical protein